MKCRQNTLPSSAKNTIFLVIIMKMLLVSNQSIENVQKTQLR